MMTDYFFRSYKKQNLKPVVRTIKRINIYLKAIEISLIYLFLITQKYKVRKNLWKLTTIVNYILTNLQLQGFSNA